MSGDGAFLSIPYNSNLEVPDQLTITVWYQHEEQRNQISFFPVIEQSTPAFGGHSRYGIWLQGDSYWGCIEPDDCGNAQLCQRCISVGVDFEIGQWYHLAFTYDNTTLRLYVDGEQVQENQFTTPTGISTRPDALTIGVDVFDQNPSFLTGHLDEVRIYKRALSVSDINSVMQASCTTSVIDGEVNLNYLYPNPTNSIVYTDNRMEGNEISVIDIGGNQVGLFIVNDSAINLCDLVNGIYYLRQNQRIIGKVILTK